MGGEELSTNRLGNCSEGLPPRGRGRVFLQAQAPRRVWITPAWAGKRAYALATWWKAEDYPRVGGEEPMPETRVA